VTAGGGIEARALEREFKGGIRAVDGVDIDVAPGEIYGFLGPNGAGKSTGLLQPDGGRVLLDGEDITGLPPHQLFRKGLLRTFQIAHEFGSLSVRENLMMVPPGQSGESLFKVWFQASRIDTEERRIAERADEVLDFLTLSHLADARADSLSGGQKKLLELGRTMMTDARVVFLDEVGAGVNRTLLNTIGEAIVRLNRERGYTFCVIEHDMSFISRFCDPVICMAEGKVLAQGTAEEIRANEQVIEAYLGRGLKHRGAAAAGQAA